ncbi:type III secretion needle formation regulating protein [Simkania negevensis Z]|uniref:Type III secretion needle formation regulating protein n=1 Tax=Simkania negevensis (strain ATCC VR-1471 / DSM 27360 / Z) TaxID=331113 RepID=F8L3L5_SIMNZ|nr:type III secretion needle formation regulating protein [Simkania negevensis Z]
MIFHSFLLNLSFLPYAKRRHKAKAKIQAY